MAAESWHREWPDEAVNERATSAAFDWRFQSRELLKLGTMKRAYWWKFGPVVAEGPHRDPTTAERPPRTTAVVDWSQLTAGRNSLLQAAELEKVVRENVRESRYWALSYLYFWSLVLSCSYCDYTLVHHSWSEKVLFKKILHESWETLKRRDLWIYREF